MIDLNWRFGTWCILFKLWQSPAERSDFLTTRSTCLFLFFVPSQWWVTSCLCACFTACVGGYFNTSFLFLSLPSHSFISSFLLIRLPLQCQPTCQSLLLFPPLLTTSSSCGTQRDRSVSESPWCNTTIVTSTLCSLCMMSPARPASAAWLPGLKSAGRTPSDRKFPGNYTGSLQGYKSGFNHHKPFQFDHPETVLLF